MDVFCVLIFGQVALFSVTASGSASLPMHVAFPNSNLIRTRISLFLTGFCSR